MASSCIRNYSFLQVFCRNILSLVCIFQDISAHVKAQVVLPCFCWPKGMISSMIRCSMRAREGLHRVKELADRPQSLLAPRHHSWICWIILVFLLRVWYESYSKRFHFYYWKQILILNMNLKEFRLLNWSGTLWMLKSAPVYMPEEPKKKNWQEKETNSARGIWGSVREWWISAAFILFSWFVRYSDWISNQYSEFAWLLVSVLWLFYVAGCCFWIWVRNCYEKELYKVVQNLLLS